VNRLIGVVFGVLVAATFAAFFVAQRLKNTPSFVQKIQIETFGPGDPLFSPNGDGRRDRVRFSMLFKKAGRVTLQIVNADGDVVRTLLNDREVRDYQGLGHVIWDGRDDDGRIVPDGRYKLRISLRDQGRTIVFPTSIVKDGTPPHPRVTAIGPQKAYGPELLPEPDGGPAHIHFLQAQLRPRLLIFRTGPGRERLVRTIGLHQGDTKTDWDGTDDGGRRVSPGVYLAVPEWRDPAGNIGTSVPLGRDGLPVIKRTPPTPLPGRGGLMVRYVGARPPTTPVKARDRLTIAVDARLKRYSWDIRKLGDPQPRTRSSQPKTKPFVTFGAPGGASGLYLFEARTRAHATRIPVAVQARRSVAGTAAKPRGVLVLLPLITWQGRNPVDDDGDGAPNTLDLGVPTRPFRIMAGSGLPQGFVEHEAPLLQWLGRNGKDYDITTDMGLLVRRGPRLTGHHGVLIAGDSRWLPAPVRADLRTFARRGGTVVSLGTDSLRRTVRLDSKGRLAQPSPPRPTDLFGARLRPLVTKTTNLEVFDNDPELDLFKGSEGLFSAVPAWEETARVGDEADLLSSAVTQSPPGKRVVVAVRFGKGLAIRPGFPAFAPRLVQSPPDSAVSALMARMWTLLSH
jgi:hypothetical protein